MTIALQVLAAMTAFIAAWLWYRASKLPAPSAIPSMGRYLGNTPFDEWVKTVSTMNKQAALWTGISAVLNGLSFIPWAHIP